MKRFLLLLTIIFINTAIFAQTSTKEYDFLTKDYASQTAKGIVPELKGYYLEDLLELSDKTGKVKLLYKNNQESMVPVATQFHIYDGDRTFYVCVPNEKSEETLFAQYSDDIQNIFKLSGNAQAIFSVIMIQYPIELQKYYDEIKALEQAYAMHNTLEDKGANPTIEEELVEDAPVINARDNATKSAKPKKEPVVISPAKEVLIVNEYSDGNNTKAASGKAKIKIAGGLARREVKKKPAVYNSTTKTGTVRLNVCVDNRGKIVKITYAENGSTSDNDELIEAAKSFAKQYAFNPSSQSRQCGYITFDFK